MVWRKVMAAYIRVYDSREPRSAPESYARQRRRQDFVTGGGSEVWVYRGSRVRSPPVPVVFSVYQRGSLLDGLAMYLSCDTKKFHDNESAHILHNFWTSTRRGKLRPFPPGGATGDRQSSTGYFRNLSNIDDRVRNISWQTLNRTQTLTLTLILTLTLTLTIYIHCVSKKQDTKLLPITFPNVNRFS